MRNASRWAVVVLTAATLGVWAIPSRGEEPATQPSADTQGATGSVTGTVMLDGKPLANARVGLIDMAQAKEMRNRATAQGSETGATTQPSAKEKHQRPTPAATAMTDTDGKFTLTDVKAGQYVVLAQAKGEGRGRLRVVVNAGQTATVDITVEPKGQHAGAGVHPGRHGKAG